MWQLGLKQIRGVVWLHLSKGIFWFCGDLFFLIVIYDDWWCLLWFIVFYGSENHQRKTSKVVLSWQTGYTLPVVLSTLWWSCSTFTWLLGVRTCGHLSSSFLEKSYEPLPYFKSYQITRNHIQSSQKSTIIYSVIYQPPFSPCFLLNAPHVSKVSQRLVVGQQLELLRGAARRPGGWGPGFCRTSMRKKLEIEWHSIGKP